MPKQGKELIMKPTICCLALLCCLILTSCSHENTSPNLSTEAELYNTQWVFRAFEVLGDTIEYLPADHQYRVTFGDSLLQGETDARCINSYGGPYSIRHPRGIKIDYIISTRAFCRESYWRYLHELEKSGSYEIHNDTLYLWSQDYSKRLIFVRVHH